MFASSAFGHLPAIDSIILKQVVRLELIKRIIDVGNSLFIIKRFGYDNIVRTLFVTGKNINGREGKIVLIGVKKGFNNKGIGTVLAEEALKWFLNEGVRIVSVRTQLSNLSAMNFYLKLGCYIKDYDIVLSKNLLQQYG